MDHEPAVQNWIDEKLKSASKRDRRRVEREKREAEAAAAATKAAADLAAGITPPPAPADEGKKRRREGPGGAGEADEDEAGRWIASRARTTTDELRSRIDKLMAHPDAEVKIPARRELQAPRIREFNLDVMGSSAGAGSGDFHVYRAGRRREQDRIKYVLETEGKREKEVEFERDRADNIAAVNAKTEKNRLKRLKQKERKRSGKSSSGGESGTDGPAALACKAANGDGAANGTGAINKPHNRIVDDGDDAGANC